MKTVIIIKPHRLISNRIVSPGEVIEITNAQFILWSRFGICKEINKRRLEVTEKDIAAALEEE